MAAAGVTAQIRVSSLYDDVHMSALLPLKHA